MTATVLQTFETDLTRFAFAVNQLAEGRSNATGTVTLTANATTTTVTATNCGAGSVVLLAPQTANAKAEGTPYYSATAGSFTLTHANNAQTDRTFGFVCLG